MQLKASREIIQRLLNTFKISRIFLRTKQISVPSYTFFFKFKHHRNFLCLAFTSHVFTTVDKIRSLEFDGFRPGVVHVTFKRKYSMLEQLQAFVHFSLPITLKRISGLFPGCYAVKAC